MEPIFDRTGSVVAWIQGEDVFQLDGAHAAIIRKGIVFDLRGKYLGTFKNRFFHDLDGHVVAFLRGACGGPVLPQLSSPRVLPATTMSPISVPAIMPITRVPIMTWGGSWNAFLADDSMGDDSGLTSKEPPEPE